MNSNINTDLRIAEEIPYPSHCQIEGCIDDVIASPNGVDNYCFKHQIYTDL